MTDLWRLRDRVRDLRETVDLMADREALSMIATLQPAVHHVGVTSCFRAKRHPLPLGPRLRRPQPDPREGVDPRQGRLLLRRRRR
jgi:hypothetical protein